MSLILIILGAYIGIPKGIEMIRMDKIRDNYLASYARCSGNKFVEKYSVNHVNENWRIDSQEWHFDHADVVEYMMKNCPPKSNAQIEVAYAYLLDGTDRYPDMDEQKEGLKRIKEEKFVRDYQLKFLNKDLDVFRQ